MARLLTDVLDAVLLLVPEDEKELRADLAKVKQSACYTAPEVMPRLWQRAQDALQQHAPLDKGQWAVEVLRIWNGVEE